MFTVRVGFTVLLSVLVVGCSRGTPSELAEMVIRSQFSDVPSDSVACISVDGHDADQNLLTAVASIAPRVVPASACVYVADPNKGSYERESGQRAVLIDVTATLDRDEAQYLSRFHAKWGMRVLLHVRKENGSWRIVDVLEHEAA